MEHHVAKYNDHCFVCSDHMNSFKNELMLTSQTSSKFIYKFIELFAGVKLSKYIRSNAGICQDCLIKFEEYDQFITKAEVIQQELLALFRNTQETFVYIKQEKELDEQNETVHIKLPEFVKLTKVPDIKFHCKSCNKDFKSLYHMKSHLHTTKQDKKYSKNFEDSVDISQSFKKIVIKSGINYDVETFQKAFGFSSDAKSKFIRTIPPKRKFIGNYFVSEDFETVTKKAGINYDIAAFHKAFGFTKTEIESGQEILNDSNTLVKSDNESNSLKNVTTSKDRKKTKNANAGHSKPFRCEKCDKNFKSIEFFKVHLASDHDRITKKLECPDCHKILADRANLRGHLAIHSETKKFFCDRCAKSFIHKESFRYHLLIHDDIRNFQCDKCSKSFRTKSKLTVHSYIHTNQKNHVCEYCLARFSQKFSMILHVRKQHGNEELPAQVKCPICEMSFGKSMLKQHLAHSHQVIAN